VYDWLLEPLLIKVKKRVAAFISTHDLYPVLDICCGSGVQCRRIADGQRNVYGLDLDDQMIMYASSKYPHIPFLCADAARIPFRDSSLKGVILSFALHDKHPRIRRRTLQEVKRILCPGGRIVFVDFERPWNRISKIASLYIYGIERMAGKDHFRNGRQFISEGGLRSFLRHNGLEEIERHDVELAHSSVIVAEFV
jgi:demethylmenaquinone methyltransferase/2-methoxy-6-polyprenyl-1,4-benzoquinol methylase